MPVGVAMGMNGSDVAKQSAEIVLADDNFSTIITAIRKGRGIFYNLKKFMLYLLSGNLAEVLVMMIGLAFIDTNGESTFPISPVGALWINTLAAGPPALALGLEPTPTDAMERGPDEFKTIFTVMWYVDLVVYGCIMAGLALANFAITMWGYVSTGIPKFTQVAADRFIPSSTDILDMDVTRTSTVTSATILVKLVALVSHPL